MVSAPVLPTQQHYLVFAPKRDPHGVLGVNPDVVGYVSLIDFGGPIAADAASCVNANAPVGFTNEKIRERSAVVWNVAERNPIPTSRA